MRNPFRRKDTRIYDYQTCLDALADDLSKLRDHIVKHSMFVGSEDVAVEIQACIDMIRSIEEGESVEEDAKRWDVLFDYMKENMRGWWC